VTSDWRAGSTHRQLRIRGLGVHAEIHGQGKPLLMHSGLWAEAALWRPLLPYLSGYQVIAFDPPGIGRSDMPALPLTMAGLASVGAIRKIVKVWKEKMERLSKDVRGNKVSLVEIGEERGFSSWEINEIY